MKSISLREDQKHMNLAPASEFHFPDVLVRPACPAQGHFLSGEQRPQRDSEGEDDDTG